MAGIDTSIYSQIAPPADPFATPAKILALKQGMLSLDTSQIENQLLQRNLGGQQAVQDALSAATRPDGTIDMPTLHNKLSGTPGALQGPALTQEGQKITGGNIANTGAAQGLQGAQIGSVGQIFGSVLQGGGPVGVKEGRDAILGALSAKQITPEMANTLLQGLPTRDKNGLKADDRAKAWMNGMFLRTMPGASNAGQADIDPNTGKPVTLTGGQVFTKAVGAQPPVVPTDANGNALNPDGTPTSSNLNPKTGVVTAPGGKASPAPAAKPAPTMGYVSGLAPGQANSAGISAEEAARQAAAFEKQANAAVDNKATIANMQDQLAKVATGPYADRINNAKAGFNELVDASGLPLPQFDKNKIAALDEFRKNGQILANQQFATLGGTGTDAQLSAAVHSNPGTFMSNLSNKQIMQMLQGNQDAIEAKATAWRQYQKQAGAGANFNTFSEDFNRNFSPRAFQFVHMSPDERKDMVKTMTPVEKSQLNSALQTAMDRGWINPPGAKQ